MSQTDIYAFNIVVFGFNLCNLVVCTLIFFLDFIQKRFKFFFSGGYFAKKIIWIYIIGISFFLTSSITVTDLAGEVGSRYIVLERHNPNNQAILVNMRYHGYPPAGFSPGAGSDSGSDPLLCIIGIATLAFVVSWFSQKSKADEVSKFAENDKLVDLQKSEIKLPTSELEENVFSSNDIVEVLEKYWDIFL